MGLVGVSGGLHQRCWMCQMMVRRWVWGFEEGLKLHTCSGGNWMVEIEVVSML